VLRNFNVATLLWPPPLLVFFTNNLLVLLAVLVFFLPSPSPKPSYLIVGVCALRAVQEKNKVIRLERQ
jgi:hypothetical protein